ncbi:hypothetical protein P43SY_002898 [Pythium insidiosum]|uniref:MARVEL domain-containing protein n=1 Tax=Pythium insidiosum TaxID=114742 RepID=A0AAD5L928_PYTIN|nr:hypothetical protein P43SY_002898 [Pythium insidiosum]
MLTPQAQKLIRLGARGLQLFSAVIALATIAGGVSGGGSKSTIFGILMNYTAMLYGFYATIAVELLARAPRLPMMIDVAIDSTMAIALFLAGIIVATCDAYKYCDEDDFVGRFGQDEALHCGSLGAGVAFSFIGMIAFIATVALTMFTKNNGTESVSQMDMEVTTQQVYVATATPTGELSPIGVQAVTPNSKV